MTAVSAQGNVEVFLKPGGKGNMPSAPEFRYGRGEIGVVKVFHKVEAEEFP